MKRILIALWNYEAGGAERQALYLAKGLRNRGYLVKIIGFEKSDGLSYQRFKEADFEPIATGFQPWLLLYQGVNVKRNLLKIKYLFKLISIVRSLSIDVAVPFTYPPNIIFNRYKNWMLIDKCFWNQRDEGRLFSGTKIDIRVLNNCDFIISNSQQGKEFLTKHTHRNIQIIENGIELPDGDNAMRNVDGVLRVVMVANIHLLKDHITLLKAFRKLIYNNSIFNIELLLVGKKMDAFDLVNNYIIENELSAYVKITGPVDDVNAVLAISDIGILSSMNEGVPNAVLEYMANGLPVVATRISGTLEALGADYPYLTKHGNVDDLADKILRLIENKDERIAIGRQNKKRVMLKYSMEGMIDKYEVLINS